MSKRKTNEEFIAEMQTTNPNIIISGQYINSNTKIECKCKICKYNWCAVPSSLLNGKGCPKCAIESRKAKRRKPHEQFVKEINILNSKIKILNTYINCTTKVDCKCLICGHIWSALPSNLSKGQGCPVCGIIKAHKAITKHHNDFVCELSKINPNIKLLGQYINNKTKVECVCLQCNHKWFVTPHNLLRGQGCPECAKERIANALRLTHEQFVDKLFKVNPNIKVLNKYYNHTIKIDCECLKCGHKWKATPNNLLSGYGCPKCRNSKGEKAISIFLDSSQINYIPQYCFNDCKNIKPLPFDFYLPDYNMCIEYDGRQHYETVRFGDETSEQLEINLNIQKRNDNIKTKYCQDNNIKLLRIPYWDFKNIEEILKKELINIIK
jgi:very-short-patch-repair endonuclease